MTQDLIAEGTYRGRVDYHSYRIAVRYTTGNNIEPYREATIVSREGKIRINKTSVMILPPRCRNWRYLCERTAIHNIEAEEIC